MKNFVVLLLLVFMSSVSAKAEIVEAKGLHQTCSHLSSFLGSYSLRRIGWQLVPEPVFARTLPDVRADDPLYVPQVYIYSENQAPQVCNIQFFYEENSLIAHKFPLCEGLSLVGPLDPFEITTTIEDNTHTITCSYRYNLPKNTNNEIHSCTGQEKLQLTLTPEGTPKTIKKSWPQNTCTNPPAPIELFIR